MKISNKEKIMLCVLGSIIVGFLYYQFLYLYQTAQVEEKLKAESEIKQKYDTTMNTIKSMEDKKTNVKILNAKISDETESFYPTINEEKIIIELDKLLKDSGLNGGATFQPIVSNSVENSKKEVKSLADSSLQGIVDQYNQVFNGTQKSSDKVVNNSTNSKDSTSTNTNSTANTTANSTTGTSNTNTQNASKDAKKNTVQYLKCEVKFSGKYEDLDKFLNSIGQNQKKIVINSIKVSSDTLNGIKGTIDLEFYSVPKIDDELQSYLKWDINKNYGKNIPFGAGTSPDTSSASAGSDKAISKVQEKADQGDFIASVKPIASDLPTIMMGKAKDDLRTSYVYADSNSTEQVEMILSQDGDKYYYKYKTSKGAFPADYNGIGTAFVPTDKNIVLDILSRSRIDANDNSAMKLKIVNKTNMGLQVNIAGDDSNNPRVTIEGDLSNISVNNK